MENPVNTVLEEAVKSGDIEAARELLDLGADPNFRRHFNQSLIHLAMVQNNVEMIKMLIQYSANVDYRLVEYIFRFSDIEYVKELMSHIIKYNKSYKIVQMMFQYLVYSKYQGPSALDVLEFLIHHGLPIDEFNENYRTPLHLSITYKRIDFVSLLLSRGADVNKKTSSGETPLYLAVWNGDESIVKLLLKKGAQVNEKILKGETVLHIASSSYKPQIVYILLEHGANVNAINDSGKSPLTFAYPTDIKEILIKELAKLSFQSQQICEENLEYLRHHQDLQKTFDSCLDELQRMKDYEVYKGFSLYDILEMRKEHRKLIYLTKNENFVAAFKSPRYIKRFCYYDNDLDYIFEDAMKRTYILQSEEKKLYSILKNCLPELVIRKIVYFANEHLFFE